MTGNASFALFEITFGVATLIHVALGGVDESCDESIETQNYGVDKALKIAPDFISRVSPLSSIYNMPGCLMKNLWDMFDIIYVYVLIQLTTQPINTITVPQPIFFHLIVLFQIGIS